MSFGKRLSPDEVHCRPSSRQMSPRLRRPIARYQRRANSRPAALVQQRRERPLGEERVDWRSAARGALAGDLERTPFELVAVGVQHDGGAEVRLERRGVAGGAVPVGAVAQCVELPGDLTVLEARQLGHGRGAVPGRVLVEQLRVVGSGLSRRGQRDGGTQQNHDRT